MLEADLDRDEMIRRFSESLRNRGAELGIDDDELLAYELANPRNMSVDGIVRYWRKRAG